MVYRQILCILIVQLLNIYFAESAADFERCQNRTWVKFRDNCYLFEYTSQGRKLDYYDAEDFCLSRGAHLTSIHSESENEFIKRAVGTYGGRRWIGLNTLKGDDKPEWSDGSSVNFFKEQPKQKYQKEKCFIVGNVGWRPDHCALHNYPICKRPEADGTPTPLPPRTTVTPPTGNCPENWIQFEEKCYRYFAANVSEKLKYKEARNHCASLGSDHDLVSIHSMKEQAFLTQNLNDFGASAWIGMYQITSDEIGQDLVFGWVDNSRTDFTFWVPGHPPPGTWKNCGRLNYEGYGKGEWVADYCEIDKYGFICQRPSDPELPVQPSKDPKCDGDSVGYRKSCYKLESTPKTFEKAEETCVGLGGHLVSLTDSFEQSFLLNFVGEKHRELWNGLRNVENTRILQWTDSQPLYYSNWANGQPNFNPKPACAFMDNSNNLKWNLTTCSAEFPFVCEITKETPPSLPPNVLGSCPSGESSWIDIGDESCYHVSGSSYGMDWGSASRYCTAKGMKMITIGSDHQSKSLTSYLWKGRRNIWLGLIRSFDKESFIWVDGAPLNYTNWVTDEPSSWYKGKDCATVSPLDLKWRPTGCNEAAVVVCQAKKLAKSGN